MQARKPDFWAHAMPLYEVVTPDGLMRPAMDAQRGGLYCGGSATMVRATLVRVTPGARRSAAGSTAAAAPPWCAKPNVRVTPVARRSSTASTAAAAPPRGAEPLLASPQAPGAARRPLLRRQRHHGAHNLMLGSPQLPGAARRPLLRRQRHHGAQNLSWGHACPGNRCDWPAHAMRRRLLLLAPQPH